MTDTASMILILIGGVVLWMVIYHRYRHWKANKLLDDVIKGKDSFRH